MGNYSKLIASLVGAAAGLLVSYGLVPENAVNAEMQAALVVIITGIITYLAPANKPS